MSSRDGFYYRREFCGRVVVDFSELKDLGVTAEKFAGQKEFVVQNK